MDSSLPGDLSLSVVMADYACRPEHSRGRLYAEPDSPTRTPFQRDRDRIIHSTAFRRLQYKTQVFVYHEGDNFRTRLTHSLEVAQIARSISRVLGLDEDLSEAVALAHDLGHTPFGHAGEDVLREVLKDHGGFDHNVQSLRVVTKLERRYVEFDGLNLTWETLEGLVKHNGPLTGPQARHPNRVLPAALINYVARHNLELDSFAGAEAQVAAIADDIAYNNHDLQDGLKAGLFTIADLADVPLAGEVFATVARDYPDIERDLHIHESVRRMIGLMVLDVLAETRRRIAEFKPQSADDVRRLPCTLVAMSEAMAERERALKKFLFTNMYRHYSVNRMTSKGRRVVRALFDLLVREPECLPPPWYQKTLSRDRMRVVADYVAGMTDRFAFDEYRRLFDMQEKP